MSFRIAVYFRNRETKEEKVYKPDEFYDEGDPWEEGNEDKNCFHAYPWAEGNFSCDCNRSIFMYDDWEYECNPHDNVIVVDKIVRTDTGEIIYSDKWED